MKYRVIKAFTCKLDHRKYSKGDTYETGNPTRAAFLQGKGRLGAMVEEVSPAEPPAEHKVMAQEDPPVQEPKHVGGGWWENPGGQRYKGKEAALAAMNGGE